MMRLWGPTSASRNVFKSIRETLVRTTTNCLTRVFFEVYQMGSVSSAQSNDVFDYRFSGISVWLEPGEDYCGSRDSNGVSSLDRLKTKMSDLAEICGGPPQGLHPFQPHCTVLYNMPKSSVLAHSTLDSSNSSESDRLKDASNKLLHRCLEEYSTMRKEDSTDHLLLRPTSTYAVVCPPFRCSISFFMLELTRDMEKLHKIACTVFPPDERGGTLHPHISLVYAPMNRFKLLQADANQLAKEEPSLMEPLRAKYLSVWSTEGTISDWKRIARVELP